MTDQIDRRHFLQLTGGAVGAAALTQLVPPAAGALGNTELSPLVLSSDLYASPAPQRFVFAVAVGSRFASFKRAQVAFAPPGATEGTVLDTRLLKDGLPRGRGLYRVDVTFPEPGIWDALLLTRGEQVPFAIDVKPAAEAPQVGVPAPRVASPTTAARLGVKPICTRSPVCGLHETSLDQLTGNGTPLAVIFATPALCESQYCGPVLDQLLELGQRYAGRIQMAHVEIYTSNRGATRAPTVIGWNLPSEPWLFAIDGAGVIRGRLDGAFSTPEIVEILDPMVA